MPKFENPDWNNPKPLTIEQELNKLHYDSINNEYIGRIGVYDFKLSRSGRDWECSVKAIETHYRFYKFAPHPAIALGKAMKFIANEVPNA